MMLAETTPSATEVLLVLGFLISLLGNVSQFGMWWQSRKKQSVELSPDPVTVQFAKRFADKHEFDRHVQENAQQHEALRGKLDQDRQQSNEHISQRQKTIFDAINSMRSTFEKKMDDKHEQNSGRLNHLERLVGGLEKSTELQNQLLARMEIKLDRVAER
jgi:DNA anti-recombination protein RmuC